MNKILEYNLKLNEEYFLFSDDEEWALIRSKHFTYEVMNSKENTEEELKQFVKEHTIYRLDFKIGMKDSIFSLICIIISVINWRLHSTELIYFIYGMLIIILSNSLVRIIVSEHNNKIRDKIFKEDKQYVENLKGVMKKNAKKRIIK